jgi:hypothetical protein
MTRPKLDCCNQSSRMSRCVSGAESRGYIRCQTPPLDSMGTKDWRVLAEREVLQSRTASAVQILLANRNLTDHCLHLQLHLRQLPPLNHLTDDHGHCAPTCLVLHCTRDWAHSLRETKHAQLLCQPGYVGSQPLYTWLDSFTHLQVAVTCPMLSLTQLLSPAHDQQC